MSGDFCQAFVTALDQVDAAPSWLAPPLAGIDEYRTNFAHVSREALRAVYSQLADFMGRGAFDTLADAYIAHHPPQHWDINRYGEALPAFIRTEGPEPDRMLLSTLAEIDRLIHFSIFAPKGPHVMAEDLLALSPEEQAAACLAPHDATLWAQSPLPLAALAAALRSGADESAIRELAKAEGHHALIAARDAGGRGHLGDASAGTVAFLDAGAAGLSLSDALDRALIAEPDFALDAALARGLAQGWWCAVRPAPPLA